ncbi:rab-GTPase-TBC domain-containing protein [Chlamydoabsidia padenii]|nr:rab-GTPase-TBC domain-containing protein [Chlamydoabsidia padenii]
MASPDILQISNPSSKETATSSPTALSQHASTNSCSDASESGDTLSTIESISPKPTGRRRRGTVSQQSPPKVVTKLDNTILEEDKVFVEKDDAPLPTEKNDQTISSQTGTPTDDQPDEQPDDTDWEFWSQVISDYDRVAKEEPKVLLLHVQRGVPQALRGMVWQLFAKSKNIKLEQRYMQLLNEESVYEKAILRDLERTFPHHSYFQNKEGQDALFNIVKAYSLHEPDVGYCQGIAFIAGPLLVNMPEEEAFGVLVQLMDRYQLKGHFAPQLNLLHQRMYQLDGLIHDQLPHIYRHFENQGIRSNMYASQWFMTLFAYKFPFHFVFRVYDLILAQGIEALHRLAIALLEKNQSIILSMEFDTLLQFLKNDVLEVYKDNISTLLTDAYTIKIIPKRLDKLAKEYQVESAKANTEAEAIEALRRQNKLLSDTAKQLESNMAELNKEHIQVANQLIETKMDIARINDENDALRQQAYDLKKALETLPGDVEMRVKDELEVLSTKNAALMQRNTALEDQLAYMEKMVVDIKVLYAESENEREALRQRLADLKRLMGQHA